MTRRKLAIVGGGFLGAELANALDAEMDVTLIERSSHFTHDPAMIRAMVRPGLLDTAPIPFDRLLARGPVLRGDAVAIGSRARTPLADRLAGVEHAADGRVKVDGWLRPSSLPHVFAAGDMIAGGDAMTIVAIARQKPWLHKTLGALASGRPLKIVKPYAPWGDKAPVLIPLGPNRGNAPLMIATLGDWVTRRMKGRDLFITKSRKLLHQS